MTAVSFIVRSVVALSAVGASAVAAQSRPCALVLDSAGLSQSREIRKGLYHTFVSGGVSGHCRGEQTTMRADSVAWYADLERLDMVRGVVFQDTAVRLDADRAVYNLRTRQLDAYGNVTLLNRKTRSRLMGPNLTYYRAGTGGRDSSEMTATQKPRAEYRSERDSGGEPYYVNADRMRFVGSSRAWAGGGVRVRRTDFTATSDSAHLDIAAGDGLFVGHAEVQGGDSSGYTLTGRSIRYRMQQNRLVWVQARGQGDAKSTEWRLVADTVEFDIGDQRVNGGRAWGDSIRPRAVSRSYTILADSLALDSPGQRLEQLRGYGKGYATSRDDESRRDADWMSGDTIVAQFDSTVFSRSTLTELKALGNSRALYHVVDPKHPTDPGINYSRGKEIAARFTPLGLDRVDVVGGGDGVYLEPGPPAPPATAPPDTTRRPP